jgi:hypothetical protein
MAKINTYIYLVQMEKALGMIDIASKLPVEWTGGHCGFGAGRAGKSDRSGGGRSDQSDNFGSVSRYLMAHIECLENIQLRVLRVYVFDSVLLILLRDTAI